MQKESDKKDEGLIRIIQKGKAMFRIPENTQHYSKEAYRLAEKKFIKLCIIEGRRC